MIDGLAPIHLIEAPTQGSGKGLLASLISIVSTGSAAEGRTVPENEDEVRKMITAELVTGRPIILLDNLSEKTGAGFLRAGVGCYRAVLDGPPPGRIPDVAPSQQCSVADDRE